MCNRKGADDNGHMAEEPRAWKARTRGSEAEVDGVIRPSTVTGRSYAVGCVHTGVFHKRNSRSTWGFSSSCTTCESEAKRCWERSLSYSSQKTLESNKSDMLKVAQCLVVCRSLQQMDTSTRRPPQGAPRTRCMRRPCGATLMLSQVLGATPCDTWSETRHAFSG